MYLHVVSVHTANLSFDASVRLDQRIGHGHCRRDMTQSNEEFSNLSFEDALKRLEAIVQKLESGDVPLDKSIDLYSEGDRLRAQCQARLESAQARIEKISLGKDGQASGTAPVDAG